MRSPLAATATDARASLGTLRLAGLLPPTRPPAPPGPQVLENISRQQLGDHLAEMLPAVQAALCDSDPAVREAAGGAFAILFRGGAGGWPGGSGEGGAGGQAVLVECTAEQPARTRVRMRRRRAPRSLAPGQPVGPARHRARRARRRLLP
jgi:hypothetical protein